MPATTPRGFPYVLPADHPLEYPPASQQLANLLDARTGLRVAQSAKASNSAGLASGAASGLAASLADVPNGATVLVVCQSYFSMQTGAVPTSAFVTSAAGVGLTPVGTLPNGQKTVSALNVQDHITMFWVFTATAATCTIGYAMTFSSSGTWTAAAGSNITMITHA